jgi:hypothetical protein
VDGVLLAFLRASPRGSPGAKDRIGVRLGRHSNDYMTSFHARTPDAFMIEYGWGGRSIDPAR